MSQFFTLDGTRFYNKDAVKQISITEDKKVLGSKTYLFFYISIDDVKVYESIDFKIIEDGKMNKNSADSFRDEISRFTKLISEI